MVIEGTGYDHPRILQFNNRQALCYFLRCFIRRNLKIHFASLRLFVKFIFQNLAIRVLLVGKKMILSGGLIEHFESQRFLFITAIR